MRNSKLLEFKFYPSIITVYDLKQHIKYKRKANDIIAELVKVHNTLRFIVFLIYKPT